MLDPCSCSHPDDAADGDFEAPDAQRPPAGAAAGRDDRRDALDLHQREARFVLGRAGMLTRRKRA